MSNRPHIIFAGGRTGGHMFPGLAVAHELVQADPLTQVTFAVSGTEYERELVHRNRYDFLVVPTQPNSGGARGAIKFATSQWSGYRQASRELDIRRPEVVVGLGSFASVPTCRAAAVKGIPLFLLVPNAVAGRATCWLAGSAQLVCAAFPEVEAQIRYACPVQITGTPVRKEIVDLASMPSLASLDDGGYQGDWLRRLVVIGGSQGAESLNQTVPYALSHLRSRLGGWTILHLAGPAGTEATRDLYRKFDLPAVVMPAADDMASVLALSDLAISRAGASTLAELACAGVPSLLVPYPHAKDDHQLFNAQSLAASGGARVFDSTKHGTRYDQELARVLFDLITIPTLRQQMSRSIRNAARPDAAQAIAGHVRELMARNAAVSVAA